MHLAGSVFYRIYQKNVHLRYLPYWHAIRSILVVQGPATCCFRAKIGTVVGMNGHDIPGPIQRINPEYTVCMS